MSKQVWIIMGSDSDTDIMMGAYKVLEKFGIPCKMMVSSAHRSPARTIKLARSAAKSNVACIIAGAGMAAHLAGVLASETILPVIGVPIDSSSLNGIDSLLATAQMPPGVPVACMGLGKSGATNAGLLAVQMLALSDAKLAQAYTDYKAALAKGVAEKDRKLQKKLANL